MFVHVWDVYVSMSVCLCHSDTLSVCVYLCVCVCACLCLCPCVCLCHVVAHGSEQHTDSADDLRVILIFFVQQVITVMDDRDAVMDDR